MDTLIPSLAHAAQGKEARDATKSQLAETTKVVSNLTRTYTVAAACYALYQGPKRNKESRWVPAVVANVYGSRSVCVRVVCCGPIWRRHVEQLQPRYCTEEDNDPGDNTGVPQLPQPPEIAVGNEN